MTSQRNAPDSRGGPTLAVIASLRTREVSPGYFRLTQKFVEGMTAYCEAWPGPVMAILHPDANVSSENLDDIVAARDDLPFDVRAVRLDTPELDEALAGCDVVMGGQGYLLQGLAKRLKSQSAAYVFVSEYTLGTRLQIVAADRLNWVTKLRRCLWEWGQERHNRRSVALASALQCNGMPTWEAYSKLNKNALLYFDSRVSEGMVVNEDRLEKRLERLAGADSLRLAFSGRLNAMKGADHLIEVADSLRKRGVAFTLDICGDGPLRPWLENEVLRRGLGEQVRMRGVLDFSSELMPFLRDEIDLFVCCHRQGDPSCTYLEVFACGVPIAGYGNEAFAGLARLAPVGWTSKMNAPSVVSSKIAELWSSRSEIASASRAARSFALEHTFDREFKARIEQMLALTNYPGEPGIPPSTPGG